MKRNGNQSPEGENLDSENKEDYMCDGSDEEGIQVILSAILWTIAILALLIGGLSLPSKF